MVDLGFGRILVYNQNNIVVSINTNWFYRIISIMPNTLIDKKKKSHCIIIQSNTCTLIELLLFYEK